MHEQHLVMNYCSVIRYALPSKVITNLLMNRNSNASTTTTASPKNKILSCQDVGLRIHTTSLPSLGISGNIGNQWKYLNKAET